MAMIGALVGLRIDPGPPTTIPLCLISLCAAPLAEAPSACPGRGVVRQIARAAGILLLGLLLLGVSGWGVLALCYWDHANPTLRNALAMACAPACARHSYDWGPRRSTGN